MKEGSKKCCMLSPNHSGLHKYYQVFNRKSAPSAVELLASKKIRCVNLQSFLVPYLYAKEFDTPYQISLFETCVKPIFCLAFIKPIFCLAFIRSSYTTSTVGNYGYHTTASTYTTTSSTTINLGYHLYTNGQRNEYIIQR